ncbi:hypothetical protein LTR37_002592 [Vermiconidia calcicola]|uniref:Uncharacterized protein n=1 Tax=Vermiconidia calcicola TaxID=1690605 RepID=A0ACC3NTY0_9PEZI|nr:hypothetical protein LTR37_002592 [Vermiconidia calcicola]
MPEDGDAEVREEHLTCSHPFMKDHDPTNDNWGRDKFETRGVVIRKWDQATRVTVPVTARNKEGWTRQLSRKPPQEAVPGVDYPVVQSLCDTCGQECDETWYRQEMNAKQEAEDEYLL